MDVQNIMFEIRNALSHRAWQATASYVLSGEKLSYQGFKPRSLFDPKNGTWGAVSLSMRFSALEIDPDAFPSYSDPAASAQSARAWTAGFNWLLGPNLEFFLDYGQTSFIGGHPDPDKDRPDERDLFSRFQVIF